MNQPLAYVHPGAKIAKNVVIEPFTTIDNNVVIGEGTWIGSNVTIMEGARIGKNCNIFPGSVISAIPQDLKFKGEETTAEIGNNTELELGDNNDHRSYEISFDKISEYIEYAKNSNDAEILIGGNYDKSKGYFIEPTVIKTSNPNYYSMETELFGPVVTIYEYEDDQW